jgi:pantothenate kinase type III
MLAMRGVEAGRVEHAILASVVPTLTETIAKCVRRAFGVDPIVVGPGVKSGMNILYENPREVGADRIVNAVAAFAWAKASAPDAPATGVIVVDFGTATTFDCVTPKGDYLGGVVGPGVKSGMNILYENPREVGADRIVNAVAAFERARGGVIVVDFGTATTFDCVTPKGEYLGGVICPGVQISAEALFSRAARLSRVELAVPPKVVGRNPVHSMQSGIVFGYAGLVDGLCARLKAELGYPCRVVATGGLARLIAPESSAIEAVDDDLTLTGLRLLFERNASVTKDA